MAVKATEKERLETKSADFAAMADYWTTTSDFLAGERAVVLAGKRYLPMFPDEYPEEYKFRLQYAKFTNIFRDVVDGLASKPFAREVEYDEEPKPSERMTVFADDVDGSGNNITVFAMTFFFNAIAYSTDWIFVDYPTVEPKTLADGRIAPRSIAEENELAVRPYWSRVSVLNIYEIKSKVIKGKETWTYFRIFEPKNGDTPDQFREMFFDDATNTASYKIWRMNEKKTDYVLYAEAPISIGVIPMVPLFTGMRNGRTTRSYPPLQGASDAQKTLYRSESGLEITKVFTAYPMLAGIGITPDLDAGTGKPKRLLRGPGITLYAPFSKQGAATDWKIIEPAGSSLTFLKDDVDRQKQDVRDLGKQPLTVMSGNLTTITTAVAAGKSKSAVKAWAIGLEDALTIACYLTALWFGETEGPSVTVYKEFDEFTGEENDMQALLSMSQAGKLSDETLWEEAQRRDVLSTSFDPEKEQERLLMMVPNIEDNTLPTDDNPPT